MSIIRLPVLAMSDVVIRVENLSKRYALGRKGGAGGAGDGLRHAIQDAVTAPFRRLRRAPRLQNGQVPPSQTASAKSPNTDEFWALNDVSFEVKRGEVLGIIGRNGAGKSTLLKILSRITEPTTGGIGIKGRVASLLEVGTGFHPELSGRENIYLNGAILGMTQAEIKGKFDEIVAFAEVEKFLDTPVKHYSSGMYVRLAFAVAAHLESEILIVDEVLAVGDSQFQKKCLSKIQDVARHERTVLFVSHNLTAIQSLCNRGVMLKGGRIAANGPITDVALQYIREAELQMVHGEWTADSAPGNHLIRIKRVRVLPNEHGKNDILTMDTPLRIETDYWVMKEGAVTHITYHLLNDQGIIVLTSGCAAKVRSVGSYQATCILPGKLLNSGSYLLKLLIVENENLVTYENDCIASFSIADTKERKHACMGREPGVVQPVLTWHTSAHHTG